MDLLYKIIPSTIKTHGHSDWLSNQCVIHKQPTQAKESSLGNPVLAVESHGQSLELLEVI